MPERQLSLVSFYGPKPGPLREIIEDLQRSIAEQLGRKFSPRPIDEVHGTIVGLEAEKLGDQLYNRTYSSRRRPAPMDLKGIVRDLRQTTLLPFDVRFFGFSPNEATQIVSRGATLYSRSFSFQGESAVMIGWPLDLAGSIVGTLDKLRRSLERHHAMHAYYTTDEDVDNDLFFVIGSVDRTKVSEDQLEKTETTIRARLSVLKPVIVQLGLHALSFVAYTDRRLPKASTRQFNLDEFDATLPSP